MTDNGDTKLESEQTTQPETKTETDKTAPENKTNETTDNELDELRKQISELKADNEKLTDKLNELFKRSPAPAADAEPLPPDAGGTLQQLAESIVNDPNSMTSRILRELGYDNKE